MWVWFGSCSCSHSPVLGSVLIIGSTCSLSIPWLNTQVLLIVFMIECVVVNQVWRCSPIWFQTCVFMVFVFGSSPNHILIKYRCPVKKSNRIELVYLTCHPIFQRTQPACIFDKKIAIFWHLTLKNLHKIKLHVNWHLQFRFWHVVWLVKKKTTRQLTL